MNVKKFGFFVLLFSVLAGVAFSQNVVLRDGIYQAPGSSDIVSIHAMGQPYEYHQMTWYVGNSYDLPIIQSQGRFFGNQLRVSITWYNIAYITATLGINHGVRAGNQVIYTILNQTSFIDGAGNTWTWRRAF